MMNVWSVYNDNKFLSNGMECLPKEQLSKIRFVVGNIIKIIDLIY